MLIISSMLTSQLDNSSYRRSSYLSFRQSCCFSWSQSPATDGRAVFTRICCSNYLLVFQIDSWYYFFRCTFVSSSSSFSRALVSRQAISSVISSCFSPSDRLLFFFKVVRVSASCPDKAFQLFLAFSICSLHPATSFLSLPTSTPSQLLLSFFSSSSSSIEIYLCFSSSCSPLILFSLWLRVIFLSSQFRWSSFSWLQAWSWLLCDCSLWTMLFQRVDTLMISCCFS